MGFALPSFHLCEGSEEEKMIVSDRQKKWVAQITGTSLSIWVSGREKWDIYVDDERCEWSWKQNVWKCWHLFSLPDDDFVSVCLFIFRTRSLFPLLSLRFALRSSSFSSSHFIRPTTCKQTTISLIIITVLSTLSFLIAFDRLWMRDHFCSPFSQTIIARITSLYSSGGKAIWMIHTPQSGTSLRCLGTIFSHQIATSATLPLVHSIEPVGISGRDKETRKRWQKMARKKRRQVMAGEDEEERERNH